MTIPSLLINVLGLLGAAGDVSTSVVQQARAEPRFGAPIEGIVKDSLGRPAAPVWLRVSLWSRGGEPVRTDAGPRPSPVLLRTDGEGRFSVPRLAAGRHRIEARGLGELSWGGTLRAPHWTTLAIADAEPKAQELVLDYTRPVILAEVDHGPKDTPCTLTLYDAGPVGARPWARPRTDVDAAPVPVPFLWEPISSTPMHAAKARDLAARRGRIRVTAMDVAAGRQYYVVASGQGFDPTPQLVEIPDESTRVSVSVLPPRTLLTPTVAVELEVPPLDQEQLRALLPAFEDGSQRPWLRRGQWLLMLQDPRTGVPWHVQSWNVDDSPWRELRVPPGPLRVVALGYGWRGADAEPPTAYPLKGWGPRQYGRVSKLLDVQNAGRQEVQLSMQIGGCLEVTLSGAPAVEGRLHIVNDIEHVLEPVRRPVFGTRPGVMGEPGTYIVNEWTVGETQTSEMLPHGHFTLQATFPGRATVSTPVTIQAGEVTRVTLSVGN